MPKQKRLYSPNKQKILLLLLAGTALGLSRSPYAGRYILKEVKKDWQTINRLYLYKILREFKYDRLVDWREDKDGGISVVLSEKGKITASKFYPDDLTIPTPKSWDKRWRVVIYDIPHKKRVARDALRLKLKELGFKEWQKSVFIYPYPCKKEIDFVIEFFDLRPYVRYAELIKPTNEAELLIYFKL